MHRKLFICLLAIFCLATLLPLPAQKKPEPSLLEKAIENKDYKKADEIISSITELFIAVKNYDTLIALIPYIGEVNNARYGSAKAATAINAHILFMKQHNASPKTQVNAHRAAADFYASIGQSSYGYDASKASLSQTILDPSHTNADIAQCEYNMGVYAYRLGNINLSLSHHRKAMQIRASDPKTDPENIYLSSNAIGSLMWNASKYDSATIFYNAALDALKKMPDNDVNKYFRPGNVYNNLAALYSAQGNTTDGINAMENTIDNFQKFIVSNEPDSRKQSATEGLYEGIDNLAGIYKEIGDFGKAGELLKYSYHQKLQKLDSAHQGIFISEILLGQYYRDIHEYDSAQHYLHNGIAKLEKAEGDYLFWAADAYYSLAMLHEDKQEIIKATEYYKKSEDLYEHSYQGEYDNVYMDFLRSASLFYVKNNQYNDAVTRANKVYDYLLNVGAEGSLQAFYQLLNIAEINFIAKRYTEARQYSNNAVNIINAKMKDDITLLDSVKMEVFKPKAILISSRSEYELKQNKDTAFLKSLSLKLQQALQMLEKRKVLIDDEKSINILISDNQQLIDFSKEIQLKLYQLTGREEYLDKFVNLHESALYNRIRGRLDKENALKFSGLPNSVQHEEQQLKKAITASLANDTSHAAQINQYLQAVAQWEGHLEKVKKTYPAYYNMRYASIFKPLEELQQSLRTNTTVIRYFISDTSLMALVADKKSKHLIHLKRDGLGEKINALLTTGSDEKTQLTLLHDLYNRLWAPLAPHIHFTKITVIPDGALYNISFEILLPEVSSTYKDLVSNSLLSQYAFSYHYSLFMVGQYGADKRPFNNYVAFAPGFSDEVKSKYLSVTKDPVKLDYNYLQLLPQPNTNMLAKKIKDLIGGDIFLDEHSTQVSFRNNAHGHKIIHIATHAQFNNVHPAQSGLVFAKNMNATDDDNFVSLYDIYNCDMASYLTLLTACESGKPGYQDGEGMVSLAHAFNYAGSERILTSLWEIDEQSCNRITEFFVRNLKDGLPTDEALRNAKLQYLKEYDGRIIAPSYWAGLVLMGEPSAISLGNQNNYLIAVVAWILLIGLVVFIFRKKKKIAPHIQ